MISRLRKWMLRTIEKSIDKTIICWMEAHPYDRLSEISFRVTVSSCLKQHWPDVDRHRAADELIAHIGLGNGADRTDRSYRRAKQVANEYVAYRNAAE